LENSLPRSCPEIPSKFIPRIQRLPLHKGGGRQEVLLLALSTIASCFCGMSNEEGKWRRCCGAEVTVISPEESPRRNQGMERNQHPFLHGRKRPCLGSSFSLCLRDLRHLELEVQRIFPAFVPKDKPFPGIQHLFHRRDLQYLADPGSARRA
jgi:hypothetical protein